MGALRVTLCVVLSVSEPFLGLGFCICNMETTVSPLWSHHTKRRSYPSDFSVHATLRRLGNCFMQWNPGLQPLPVFCFNCCLYNIVPPQTEWKHLKGTINCAYFVFFSTHGPTLGKIMVDFTKNI